jgi:hypothetical protein
LLAILVLSTIVFFYISGANMIGVWANNVSISESLTKTSVSNMNLSISYVLLLGIFTLLLIVFVISTVKLQNIGINKYLQNIQIEIW